MEIKNIPLPVIGIDKQSKVVEFNEQAEEILGSDIKGIHFRDLVHPSSLETLEKLIKGDISMGIIVLFTSQGEKDFRVFSVQEEWGNIFFLHNISTEIKLSHLLEKQRDYFKDFVNSLEYGVLILDNRLKPLGRNRHCEVLFKIAGVDEREFIEQYTDQLVQVKESKESIEFFKRFKGEFLEIRFIPFIERGVIVLISEANQRIKVLLAEKLLKLVISLPYKEALRNIAGEIMNILEIDTLKLSVSHPFFEFSSGSEPVRYFTMDNERLSFVFGLPAYLNQELSKEIFEDLKLCLMGLLNSTILKTERDFFHRVFTLSERLLTSSDIESFAYKLKDGIKQIVESPVFIRFKANFEDITVGKKPPDSEKVELKAEDFRMEIYARWKNIQHFEKRLLLTFIEIHLTTFIQNKKIEKLYQRFSTLYTLTNTIISKSIENVIKEVLDSSRKLGGDYISLIKLQNDGSGIFLHSTGFTSEQINEINKKMKNVLTPLNREALKIFKQVINRGTLYKKVRRGTIISKFILHPDEKHLYLFSSDTNSANPHILAVGVKSPKKLSGIQEAMYSELARQIGSVFYREDFKRINTGVLKILNNLVEKEEWKENEKSFIKLIKEFASSIEDIIGAKGIYLFRVKGEKLYTLMKRDTYRKTLPLSFNISEISGIKPEMIQKGTPVFLKSLKGKNPLTCDSDFNPLLFMLPVEIPLLGRYLLVIKIIGIKSVRDEILNILKLIISFISNISKKTASFHKIRLILKFLKGIPDAEKGFTKYTESEFFKVIDMNGLKNNQLKNTLRSDKIVEKGGKIYFLFDQSAGKIAVFESLTENEKKCLKDVINVFASSLYERNRIEEFNSKFLSLSKSLKSVSLEKSELASKEILKEIVKTLDLTYAGLLVNVGEHLELSSFYSKKSQKLNSVKIPLEKETVTTKALKSGKPVIVQNVEQCSFYLEGVKGIKSELALPLVFGDEKLGVLDLGRKKIEGFSNLDILFAEDVSHLLSVWLWIIFTGKKIIEEKRLTSLIMDNITTGLIITDRKGVALKTNRFIEEWLGENINGKNVVEYFSQDSMKRPLKGEFVDRILFGFRDKYFGYSGAPMYDEKGEIIGGLYIIRDLTDIREMEERVKRQDRLAALGEMSAGMAHEIKNPLAAVKAGIEYIMKDVKDKEKIESFKLILKEINRVDRIVKGMLSFARRPPLRMKMFDICSCIEKVLAIYSINVKNKRIKVEVNCPGSIIMYGDEDQITEVITNLFLNAVDATPEKGRIWIEVSEKENMVILSVSDNGTGIPEDVKDRIFNPFFTTRSYGTGLGLSICHRIVTDHGGAIKVENNSSGGATFTVSLPGRKNGRG